MKPPSIKSVRANSLFLANPEIVAKLLYLLVDSGVPTIKQIENLAYVA